MDKEPGWVHRGLDWISRFLRTVIDRISKLFDRIIYNDRLSLIVSGLVALAICVSINYQDLSFQFFRSDAVTLNLAAVPVEVLVDENSYEVSGVPTTADVTVVGDPADIQLVRTQNSASVTADLRSMNEGTNTVHLEPSGLPTGLEVTVNPSAVQVILSRKFTKTFFITPDLIVGSGQSVNAYSKPALSSRSVTIKATKDKLNAIRTVRAIVDTSGHEGAFEADVPLVAYDSAGKQVSVDMTPSTVTATVTLAGQKAQQPSAQSSEQTAEKTEAQQ